MKIFQNVLGCLKSPAFIFVIIAIPCLLTLSLIVPPSFGHDEAEHYYRVQQISHGQIIAPELDGLYNAYASGSPLGNGKVDYAYMGGEINSDVVDMMSSNYLKAWTNDYKYSKFPAFFSQDGDTKFPDSKSNQGALEPVTFTNTTIYSPIAYAPHILATKIVDALNLGVTTGFYFTRIFAGLIIIFLLGLIIYLMPIAKWGMFVLCLFPTVTTSCALISSDAMNIVVTFLFVAMLLRFIYMPPDELNRYDYPLLIVSILLLSLIKITLFPFILFVLFIPIFSKVWVDKNIFQKLILAIPCGISMIIAVCWNELADKGDIRGYYFDLPGGIHAQLQYILDSPIRFVEILFQSIGGNYWSVFGKIIIDDPYRSIEIVSHAAFTYLPSVFLILALIVSFLIKTGSNNITIHKTISISSIVFIILQVFGTYLVLYLSFTPVSEGSIWGVQGRYFIPCLPLVVVILYNSLARLRKKLHSRLQTVYSDKGVSIFNNLAISLTVLIPVIIQVLYIITSVRAIY